MQVLVVGAHPDDAELGAGGLIRRLILNGHEVKILILTDESGRSNTRRTEALNAAAKLGVHRRHVLFAGFKDGDLYANGRSVGLLRTLALKASLSPAVVVVHSNSDSHNDHVNANTLLHATFRRTLFLSYSIHISAVSSRFAPRFFINLTDDLIKIKRLALEEYKTQKTRIEKLNLDGYEAELGAIAGLERAEAFEIDKQAGATAESNQILALNDSPFHKLWFGLIGQDEIYLLYRTSENRPQSIDLYSRHHEDAGRDMLREEFAKSWFPRSPLRERTSSLDAQSVLEQHHVLLAGGSVNNPIVRTHFNHFKETDWVVECDMPLYEPVYLFNKSSGKRIHPQLNPKTGALSHDVGVLTIMKNPFNPERWIISCAAVHGIGTQGLLNFLANPAVNLALLDAIKNSEMTHLPLRIRVKDLKIIGLKNIARPPKIKQLVVNKGSVIQ
jgi:LmbE family N-acetylglucosaminyl deacetylase